MSALLAALYSLCLLLLTAFSLYVFCRNPRSRLNRYFALLALALLGWVASLFAFNFPLGPGALLWVGRLNFACIVFVATLGFLFVQALPAAAARAASKETVAERRRRHGTALWLWAETALLGAVTLVTNVVLPYAFRDFRLIHVGTLSTILFVAAAGYAVFARHLFNVRVIVRAAFVYAGVIALALELYQLAVTFLAHLLPFGNAADRGFAATAVALVINAFTQQPVRRWVERIIDGYYRKHHPRHPVRFSRAKLRQIED